MTALLVLGVWSVVATCLCLLLGAVVSRREQVREAPATAALRLRPTAVPTVRAAVTAVVPVQGRPSPARPAAAAQEVGSPS